MTRAAGLPVGTGGVRFGRDARRRWKRHTRRSDGPDYLHDDDSRADSDLHVLLPCRRAQSYMPSPGACGPAVHSLREARRAHDAHVPDLRSGRTEGRARGEVAMKSAFVARTAAVRLCKPHFESQTAVHATFVGAVE